MDEFNEIHQSIWNKQIRHKKVALHAKEYPPFVETVYDLAFKIDLRYNIILSTLLKKPEINITEIVMEIQEGKKTIRYDKNSKVNENEYKKIRRMVYDLTDINYIQKVSRKGKPIGNFKKVNDIPYELTLSGIFYILINNIAFNTAIAFELLLKNYPNNALFKLLLYPYFEKVSLEKLPFIHYPVVQYLGEVCNIITIQISSKDDQDGLIDGHLPLHLFRWSQEQMSNNINTKNMWKELRKYLDVELGWKWIYDAKIDPDFFNNVITIKSEVVTTSPIIIIYPSNNRAFLKYRGKSFDIFKVSSKGDYLEISGKSILYSKLVNENIKNGLFQKLVLLLLNINLYNKGIMLDHLYALNQSTCNHIDVIKNILSKDKKFVKLSEKIIGILQEQIK